MCLGPFACLLMSLCHFPSLSGQHRECRWNVTFIVVVLPCLMYIIYVRILSCMLVFYIVFVVASGHQLVAHYRFLLNASHFTDASMFIFCYLEPVCQTLPSILSMCIDASFGRVFIFVELVET